MVINKKIKIEVEIDETIFNGLNNGAYCKQRLNLYVMGSSPIFRANNFENRPIGRAKD